MKQKIKVVCVRAKDALCDSEWSEWTHVRLVPLSGDIWVCRIPPPPPSPLWNWDILTSPFLCMSHFSLPPSKTAHIFILAVIQNCWGWLTSAFCTWVPANMCPCVVFTLFLVSAETLVCWSWVSNLLSFCYRLKRDEGKQKEGTAAMNDTTWGKRILVDILYCLSPLLTY